MESWLNHPIHKSFTEKSWFTFSGNQRRGPFSDFEIRGKLIDESLLEDDYIWSEGMKSWVPISEVPHFKVPSRPTAPRGESVDSSEIFTSPVIQTPVVKTLKRAVRAAVTRVLAKNVEKRPYYLWATVIVGVALGGGAISLHFGNSWREKLLSGSVGHLFIPDISTEDDRAIHAAITKPLEGTGVQLALAISLADPSAPTFYVGGNVKDGLRLTLQVEGIQDTLLSIARFNRKLDLTIKDGIAQSPAIRELPDGTLPIGVYRVSVGLSGKKPLVVRDYFLGGLRDQEYFHSLRQFHRVIRSKATEEIHNLRELMNTVEMQLMETDREFLGYSNAQKSKSALRVWRGFDRRWMAFADQLGKSMSDSNEVYYDALTETAKLLIEQVKQLHLLQNRFVQAPELRSESGLRIAEDTSLIQSAIISFRMKLNLAERTARAKNEGLPGREGN